MPAAPTLRIGITQAFNRTIMCQPELASSTVASDIRIWNALSLPELSLWLRTP